MTRFLPIKTVFLPAKTSGIASQTYTHSVNQSILFYCAPKRWPRSLL